MREPVHFRINEIVDILSYPSYYGIDAVEIKKIQEEIDRYSKPNPDDETYGMLLLAQSLVHYRNKKYDDALKFADAAYDYGVEERVMYELLDDLLPPEEKNRYLIGLNGWLFWFTLGLFIAIPSAIYSSFKEGFNLPESDIAAFNSYNSGFGGMAYALNLFENISIIVYIFLISTAFLLLVKRSRFAKRITIIAIVFGAVYSILDYALVNSFFNMFDSSITQKFQSDVNRYFADNHLRTVLSAFIWVPYFLVSKRVKATLNK